LDLEKDLGATLSVAPPAPHALGSHHSEPILSRTQEEVKSLDRGAVGVS
jgi:hypothetical protein